METVKTRKRLGIIIQGVALNVSAPLFSLFISWMVIHMQNARLWGEFVKVQVWVLIAVQFFAYGNKDYLMRAFSKNPSRLDYCWSRSFFSRAILLLVCGAIFLSGSFGLPYKGWILTWVIVRFVYQSFDVLVLYNRRFYISMAAEAIGLLLLFVALAKPMAHPTLGMLLKVVVIADLLKAIFMLLVFQGSFNLSFFGKFNLGYFKGAFMFFLLGITALLSTRMDQLCVNYFMAPAAIARYQVFMTLCGFMQLGASLVLSPFIKNLFRLHEDRFRNLSSKYHRAGILLAFGQVLVILALMRWMFHFTFSPAMYGFAYLYILAFYFYYTEMIDYTKRNRQHIVVLIMLSCSCLNLFLTSMLIPVFQLEGALLSGALSQWLIYFLFILAAGKVKIAGRLSYG
jgi:O-antigen/teichoic acid export membrane protein